MYKKCQKNMRDAQKEIAQCAYTHNDNKARCIFYSCSGDETFDPPMKNE